MKIFLFPQTSFDIASGEHIHGEFSLEFDENRVYSFHWIPNQNLDKKMLEDKNVPSNLLISFKHLTVLTRKRSGIKTIQLLIELTDSSRLPWFTFDKKYDAIVVHMFEFLVYKKILSSPQKSGVSRLKYQVQGKTNNTDIDVFGYVPNSQLDPKNLVLIAQHNKILKSLNYNPSIFPPPQVTRKEFDEYMKELEINTAFSEIANRGLAEEARPYVWPIILGLYQNEKEKEQSLKQKLDEYLIYKKQWNLLTQEQIDNSRPLMDIIQVSENDVRRNDRNLPQFKEDDSPNLALLRVVLRVYSMYNRNCGYVQGMADIVTPLILLFIKSWKNDNKTAIFFDESERTMEEAESFIFWSFASVMNITQQDRVFGDLEHTKNFVIEKAATLAKILHPPLRNIIGESKEINDMIFLFSPYILLFKRDFKLPDVYRVWDTIFTCSCPYLFARYILTAVLLLIFPKMLIKTDGALWEVMGITDGFLQNADVRCILQLALTISEKVKKLPKDSYNDITMPISWNTAHSAFKPKFMKLK